MEDPLLTYLHDHMAASMHASTLLTDLRERYHSDPLGQFAHELLQEVDQDRATLKEIVEGLGHSSVTLKELGGWLGEKLSRIKLRLSEDRALGTFEGLEFLALGIHGKRNLWRVLRALSSSKPELQSWDFERLMARAEEQQKRVEHEILEIVRPALLAAKS